MPRILSEKIGLTVVQSAFLHLGMFSVCGGAAAFSNKPFKQWPGHNNTSNVGDLQVHCVLM